MTRPSWSSPWADGVAAGAACIACTRSGFWLRGRVVSLGAAAKVVFQDPPEAAGVWLPRLQGFAEPTELVPPERVAPLPEKPPTVLPPVGAPVIVLWDGKRFHPATLLRRDGERQGVVRHDEGDDEVVTADRVLSVGMIAPGSLARAAGLGLGEGASVRVDRGDGWVSAVGTDAVYVRFEGASHGRWYRLADVKPGGRAHPPRPPKARSELSVGARVSARWVDRVFYPGRVRTLRDDAVEIVWDDGAVGWIPRARAVAVELPKPVWPQEPRTVVTGPEGWAPTLSMRVKVRKESGSWTEGTVTAARGGEAWVTAGTTASWVGRQRLAVPPTAGRFPAKGTGVLVLRTKGSWVTGRALESLGETLEVALDGGGRTTVVHDALYLRPGKAAPTEVKRGVSAGAEVDVETRPGEWMQATVKSTRDGTARIVWPGSAREETVDLARVRAREREPHRPLPPPPVAPAPEPVEAAEPEPDDLAQALVRTVVDRWRGASSYRGDTRTHRLDVAVGELSIEARASRRGYVVHLTASGKVEAAPPVDSVSVRLARWVRGRLGGRADDPAAIAEADRAWANQVVAPPLVGVLTRADAALVLTVEGRALPEPADVVRWGRALHARLLGDETE